MAIKQYEGKLGKFEYDDEIFSVSCVLGIEYLRYIGNETDGSKIKIPEGIVNCFAMFWECKFLEAAPTIPEGVVNCSVMFCRCTSLKEAPFIPEGVKYCSLMFSGCESLKKAPSIPEGVVDCSGMFLGCSICF